MAFRKLSQIVRSTLQTRNHVRFAEFPVIHRNIVTPGKIINPKTKVTALSRLVGSLREIHMDAFLRREEADAIIKHIRPASENIKLELLRNVVVLTCDSVAEGGKCDVYLIGTDHVLRESCMQVRAIINHLKPQIVFLELCEDEAKNRDLFDVILRIVYAKARKELKIKSVSEFRVAYEEAKKYGGKVILGDRPEHITSKRGWGRMSIFDKTKFCFLLLRDGFQKITKEMPGDKGDEFLAKFPTLMKALVDERDQYMSSSLLDVASKHSSVVAVVGFRHISGIKEYWKKPNVIEDLL